MSSLEVRGAIVIAKQKDFHSIASADKQMNKDTSNRPRYQSSEEKYMGKHIQSFLMHILYSCSSDFALWDIFEVFLYKWLNFNLVCTLLQSAIETTLSLGIDDSCIVLK